jgi:hypothetical protein
VSRIDLPPVVINTLTYTTTIPHATIPPISDRDEYEETIQAFERGVPLISISSALLAHNPRPLKTRISLNITIIA